jgi:nucleoside-diphosphate-sugar epimerase
VITIGIIGASGQVGTEVCLFLMTYPDVRPIAIVRAGISGALLRRLGVEVRVCSLEDAAQSKDVLGDCDLVVDFSVKTGDDVARIKAHYRRNITRALDSTRAEARYVFISSINAFGMSAGFNRAKNYRVPHSLYAVTKRYAENLAMRSGKRLRKETHVFRLGHVHGLLQRVSEETCQLVRQYRRFEYPDTPSYTIFCYTIAEGLIHVAQGHERPGIYTLISEPAWSWREVLNYYVEPGSRIEVELCAAGGGFWRRAAGGFKGGVMQFLSAYRETLKANLLHHAPSLERRAAAYLYVQRARQQIREFQNVNVYRPPEIHEGVFPGLRLSRISDSRFSMSEKTDQVRDMLRRLPGSTRTESLSRAVTLTTD